MTVSERTIEPPASSIVSAGAAIGGMTHPVRALLVEGNPVSLSTLATVLAKLGFEVQSVDEDVTLRQSLEGRPGPAEKIAIGKLVIDQEQRRVWWDDVEVSLTSGQFDIVVLLAGNAGNCVDNRTIYDCLHYKGFLSGHGQRGFWVNIRSVIRHIRHKFREVDSSFDELENARSYGYRWRTPS
jgi:DNA-binding winged helix-turn-helix (wHTH) protein